MEDETMGVFRGLDKATGGGTSTAAQAQMEACERRRQMQEAYERHRQAAAAMQKTAVSNQIVGSGLFAGQWQQTPRPDLQAKLRLYGPAPHPAFHEKIVDLLLKMAESSDWAERLAAVHHELTPHARIIMMLGDKNDDVRTAAEMRVAYEDEQNGE